MGEPGVDQAQSSRRGSGLVPSFPLPCPSHTPAHHSYPCSPTPSLSLLLQQRRQRERLPDGFREASGGGHHVLRPLQVCKVHQEEPLTCCLLGILMVIWSNFKGDLILLFATSWWGSSHSNRTFSLVKTTVFQNTWIEHQGLMVLETWGLPEFSNALLIVLETAVR